MFVFVCMCVRMCGGGGLCVCVRMDVCVSA